MLGQIQRSSFPPSLSLFLRIQVEFKTDDLSLKNKPRIGRLKSFSWIEKKGTYRKIDPSQTFVIIVVVYDNSNKIIHTSTSNILQIIFSHVLYILSSPLPPLHRIEQMIFRVLTHSIYLPSFESVLFHRFVCTFERGKVHLHRWLQN